MRILNYSIFIFLLFWSVGCFDSTNQELKTESSQYILPDSLSANTEVYDTSKSQSIGRKFQDIYDRHRHYDSVKNEILGAVKSIDSLGLWKQDTLIRRFDRVESSLSAHAFVCSRHDSLSFFSLIGAVDSGWAHNYYVINGQLRMHISIFYDSYDSSNIGGREILEELSILEDNKIIYQLSPDCGAPNSLEYIQMAQEKIVKDFEIIRKLINEQD